MESPGYKPSLSEIAYRRIKEMILSLTLAPGSSLTEMGLIDQLGMSRTPIREALYRLQQERFVELTPRKGWFVSEIKLQDIQQLFVIREALEGIATRQATQRTPDHELAVMADKLAALEQ
uniref:HTH gntR-type domain-containing protein n=2 Tax=cellular organisms TaxID=131567 RepID=A0A8R2D7D9_ACYPI